MVKRTLVVLAIAAGLIWWYEKAQAPEVAAVKASAPTASSLDTSPPAMAKGVGTRPAGGWSPKAWSVVGGKLTPSRALRDRFDSYLPLGKGVTMVEVRATIEQDAQADLGQAQAALVLAIWDRYARLQNHDWRYPFNPTEPKGWQTTLNEQHQVRRQMLGADWAEAFFGDDEAAFQRRIANMVAARPDAKLQGLDAVLASAPSSAGNVASSVSAAASASRGSASGLEAVHAERETQVP